MAFLDTYRSQIIGAARIVVGFLFSLHGGDKFFGWFGGGPDELGPLLVLGGAIELVGGALVCVGLQTRIAAFVCSGTMAVAYFLFHQQYGALPIQNDGELAAMYSWTFLLLAAIADDGAWSLGKRIASRSASA